KKKYAQEILSTFGTGIGEVALVPTTGGIFSVAIVQSSSSGAGAGSSSGSGSGSGSGDRVSDGETRETETLLWDRKRDGGFPGMGSVSLLLLGCWKLIDRALRAAAATATATATPAPASTLDPVDNQTCQDYPGFKIAKHRPQNAYPHAPTLNFPGPRASLHETLKPRQEM
ncbi:hypothetical protein AOCH_006773, partial [Aspergillus ochraceoroseus]